ncbi:hypothetical protein [Sphingobium abikonense]|uniref:hypothetical protein n=1 Tax=Sphingobium abikonense TaxID=86193 RepID=UPI003514ECBB
MDNDSPGLGVGFTIDPEGSFDTLRQLQAAMDSTEGRIVREAASIEKATGGMVKLGGAVIEMDSFRNAATRAAREAAQEFARVEKAGEAMVRQLERQNASFGKTRDELRALRAAELATSAESVGNMDLANRLRAEEAALYEKQFAAARRASQEAQAMAEDKAIAAQRAVAAAEAEARAIKAAAVAHDIFQLKVRQGVQAMREAEAAQKIADRDAAAAKIRAEAEATARLAAEHARLAAIVRGSQAALEADAVAAERMRMSTDPLYAATKRLNDEIAESTRLYHAGATAAPEYARQQEVLTGRLRQLSAVQDDATRVASKHGGTLTQLSFQLNDVATMAAMGAAPMQIFVSQAGQIFQVAQMAEGGVKGFALQMGGLLLRFAPLTAGLAVAGVAFSRWHDQLNDDAGLKAYASTLGLTAKEMDRLKDVTVTSGDIMNGIWKTIDDRTNISGNTKKLIDWLFSPNDAQTVANFVAEIYGAFVGGYKAVVATWALLPSAMGDLVAQATNATIAKLESMVNASIEGINGLARRANELLGFDLFGQIANVTIDRVTNLYEGAASKVASTFGDSVAAETKRAKDWMSTLVGDIEKNTFAASRARLDKQRDEILKSRSDKTDKHADKLAREAAATEAQIRNLYALADAYQVSGAAALVAEARVKAEGQAIKQRADIETAVERQIRLAIAQRVSDAAKASLATREQVAAQERVNAMVSAGLIPAERAADLVRDQIADLPLLAALQVAQQRGYVKEIEAAKRALDDQRKAREQLTAAERTASFNAAMEAGAGRIAELQAELRLIGATDAARVKALATIRATQEAARNNLVGQQAEQFIAQQVQIADLDLQRQLRAEAYNDSLRYQADLLDAIATNVSLAANGMADAFGRAGEALGGMASTFASFLADQERANANHAAQLRLISQNTDAVQRAAAEQRENALYAQRTLTSQVGLYGDMSDAAKGFFKEGSDGYKALETAEKAFRAVEFALSVRAMAQNAAETLGIITNSAAQATAEGTAGIAAQSKLPFPFNIAAMAATAGALIAAGVAVFGGFGGGGNSLPKSNDGTGTVLGDATAKSDSIKRAIESLKEVDTVMLGYSRQMAASLSSIEDQIGGFAALVLRTGEVNASQGVAEGFKTSGVGSILSNIPIIGGLLGSLFGTKTKVVGSGLYGDAQSLGDILAGGFDASYYSDIQKKKKFFGITTSTKYRTQFADADAGLENQFTLILREFNDAILAAAGPLGLATDAIQQKLNGFVVNIGKIDLQGLTGEEIEEKLTAVFGAAADQMAQAAFPGIERFQQVGEGLFETLVRVSSTVESVTSTLTMLGSSASMMSIDMKVALANQFESLSDLTDAASSYFETYYTAAEQAAARTAQFGDVFESLGLAMPSSLAGFRALVEAQDLTTAAGQATYATLLQLAPAFADLQSALNGAKSAADILSERQDLEKQLLELQGNTAAIREMELAQLDESNRALQQQIWALQDAKEAAEAADQLRQAWSSIGDSILDEVNRIRGITDGSSGGSFAALMGRFNEVTAAARAGDQDAAGQLVSLSQSLLNAASLSATSRQELDRIKAITAASLEETYAVISALGGVAGVANSGGAILSGGPEAATLAAAATTAQATPAAASNDNLAAELQALREEVAQMRSENNSGHAATASNTGAIKRKWDDVTADSGGGAITVAGIAA